MLVVSWTGQAGSEMRARYAIDGGQPVVRDLAVRKTGGPWGILGQNLTPEFRVVSGIRRMSTQQARTATRGRRRADARGDREESLVRLLGCAARDAGWPGDARAGERRSVPRAALDPAAPAREQAAADAARGPVGAGFDDGRRPRRRRTGHRGLSIRAAACRRCRSPAATSVSRASAAGHPPRERVVPRDVVQREDRRRERRGDVPGPVDGDLLRRPALHRLRGTNLLRMEALAKTNEEWIAYKYDAGLKGFSTDADAARRLARHRRPAAAATASAAWSTRPWRR